MSSIRNSGTRLVAAAATVVLAALSLTACDDGADVHDKGAGTDASTTASPSTGVPTTASPSTDAPTEGTSATDPSPSPSAVKSAAKPAASNSSKPTAGTVATKAPIPRSKSVTCEGSNTRTVAAPLQRPLNHMLLTVTNTGNSTCYLYYYPALRFNDAQAVPPVLDDSQPQAVVTLDPGESGYASVSLSAA